MTYLQKSKKLFDSYRNGVRIMMLVGEGNVGVFTVPANWFKEIRLMLIVVHVSLMGVRK